MHTLSETSENNTSTHSRERVVLLARQTFDRWATTYEQAVLEEQGSGTGLVGKELHKLGYNNLVAGDLSNQMLEECRKKGVYQEHHLITLGERLPFDNETFDGVICVGVFQPCGPPAAALEELARVCRAGGIVVVTHTSSTPYRLLETGYDEEVGFPRLLQHLASTGVWVLLEITPETPLVPLQDPDTLYTMYTFKKL